MPTLDYKQSGDSIVAEDLNEVFSELDRKTALALDNKPLPYLIQTNATVARRYFAPFFGPAFAFTPAGHPRCYSGFFTPAPYDHSVFVNALAGAVKYTGSSAVADSEQYRYALINPLPASFFTQIGRIKTNANTTIDWRNTTTLLRWSLEAHRILHTPAGGTEALYWVTETYNTASDTGGPGAFPTWLQRIRSMQQAELIFEGGVTELDFSGSWNAYNFFRVNVCQPETVTIRFRNSTNGIAHTLVVPGYSSKCVRRTGVDGVYTDGFNYFQRYISGDRRFYQHPNTNNIFNPSILIPFVNRVLAGHRFFDEITGELDRQFAAPTVMLDPQVRAPLPSGYGFGDPSVDTTKLGDLLHHPGEVVHVDSSADPNAPNVTRFTFNGYGSLTSLNGVSTQVVGDDFQIKASGSGTHDFMCLSTNLFCTAANSFQGGDIIAAPVRDASDWIALDRHMPDHAFVTALELSSSSQSLSYNTVLAGGALGPLVTQSIVRESVKMAGQYPKDTLLPHVTTAGEAKQRVDNSAALCSFESTTMQLTSSGLVLNTTQTIPLTAPFTDADPNILSQQNPDYVLNGYLASPVVPVLASDLLHHISCDGENIIIKRSLVFTGYGFPDTDNWFYTGFLTPRFTRIYSDRTNVGNIAGSHPNFREGYKNANGQEVVCTGVRGSGHLSTEIKILSPWNVRNDTFNSDAGDAGRTDTIGTMSNNDVLYGATKNVSVPGYWAGNRARLLENRIFYSSPQDGSDFSHTLGGNDARQFYRFIRMRMEVEHYNNLAAKVNSMARYKPLNWIDHGVIQNGSDQALRYRLTPNRYSLMDAVRLGSYYLSLTTQQKTQYNLDNAHLAGLRPVNQFASSSTASASEIIVAGHAGIPVLGVADLPDNYDGAVSELARFATFRAEISGVISGEKSIEVASSQVTNFSEARNGLLRPDLRSVSNYFWLSIDDVQSYASAHGYRFLYADIGCGYDLELVGATLGATSSPLDWYSPGFDQFGQQSTQVFPLAAIGSSWNTIYNPGDGGTQPGANPNPHVGPVRNLFLEFIPGSSWITGDGSTPIDEMSMDWAQRLYAKAVPAGQGRFFDYFNAAFQYLQQSPEILLKRCFGIKPFYYELVLPENLRRMLRQCSRPTSEFTASQVCESALIVSTYQGPTKLSTPIQSPDFESDWAGGDLSKISALVNHGVKIVPFSISQSGANRVQLWSDFTAPFDA